MDHAQVVRNAQRAVHKQCVRNAKFYYSDYNDRAAYEAGVVDRLRLMVGGNEAIVDSDAFPANRAAYEQGARDAVTVRMF